MIRKSLQILFLLVTTMSVTAQIPEMPKSMLSPNAASLGEYGEVPVSPFTGIPEIEIPLYEIKVGDFKMPITMSYHAGGVRPDQHPGWTGLGWTINAGGCISRVVNDKQDEYHNPYNGLPWFGYLGKCILLDSDSWNTYDYLFNLGKNKQDIYDTEPDTFSFNFFGYSGKFYLDEKRNWKVQCDRQVKVSFNDEFITPNFDLSSATQAYKNLHSFRSFTLTTEDGTQYLFGNDSTAIEYSVNIFGQMDERFLANTWYLSKITLPNSSIIEFVYERKDFICQLYTTQHTVLNYRVKSEFSWLDPRPGCGSGGTGSTISAKSDCGGQLIYPTYLSLIKTPEARVEFYIAESDELKYKYRSAFNLQEHLYKQQESFKDMNAFMPILMKNANYTTNPNNLNYPDCLDGLRWYKLTHMRIKDSKYNYIKSFLFTYNNSSSERLFLQKISEYSDISSPSGRKYRFEYYSPNLLPEYLADKTDHWGFYNGVQLPTEPIDPNNYQNYKYPVFNVGLYGTLSKITYPTGGYTKFIYEANSYRKELNDMRNACNHLNFDKPAGGLRIKKLINSDTGSPYNEYIDKEYFYLTDYFRGRTSSSGIIGTRPLYYYSDYRVWLYDEPNTEVSMNVFSSQSVLPCSNNACGNHVGYSEVIERNYDNSLSRYFYTNFDDGHFDSKFDVTMQSMHAKYEPYSSRAQDRGLLKMKEEYSSHYLLKRRLQISYENDDNSSKNYVRTVSLKRTYACPGSSFDSFIEGTAYRIYTYLPRKIKEIDCKYESNLDSLKTINTFFYNNYKLISHTSKTINNTELLHTNYKYSSDYSNPIFDLMNKSHNLSSLVEIKKSITNFQNKTFEIDKIRYSYSKTPNNNLFLPSIAYKSINGGVELIDGNYTYDIRGNIISTLKNQIDRTTYIWGYNYQYLVAEIKNATIDEVIAVIGDYNKFAEVQRPSIADFEKLNSLRVALPNSLVTTFEYKPMVGVSVVTNPNGTKVYYEYDYLSRLIQAKDNNGNIIEHYKYKYNQ